MTEDEASAWIEARYGIDARDRLAIFAALVIAENERQNLIAPSTIEAIWSRHIVDSAQLAPLAQPGLWIDVGTGGGFPGMVIALIRPEPMMMVEPRKRRAAFLEDCATELALTNVRVMARNIERIDELATTISARAVASIEKLLQIAAGCAKEGTRWLLPRGRLSEDDLAFLRRHWRGAFHVEQSLTDPGSAILVLDGQPRR